MSTNLVLLTNSAEEFIDFITKKLSKENKKPPVHGWFF
jgi:hypothetical protein